jgi:hypothetical protein
MGASVVFSTRPAGSTFSPPRVNLTCAIIGNPENGASTIGFAQLDFGGVIPVLLLEIQGGVLLVVVEQFDPVVLHELDRVRNLFLELAPVVEVPILLRSSGPVAHELVVSIEPQEGPRPARTSRPRAFLSRLDQRHTANVADPLRRLQKTQRSRRARETAAYDHQIVVWQNLPLFMPPLGFPYSVEYTRSER